MLDQFLNSLVYSFLEEESLLEECKEKAAKRVLVWQLEKEMQNNTSLKRRLLKECIPVERL